MFGSVGESYSWTRAIGRKNPTRLMVPARSSIRPREMALLPLLGSLIVTYRFLDTASAWKEEASHVDVLNVGHEPERHENAGPAGR